MPYAYMNVTTTSSPMFTYKMATDAEEKKDIPKGIECYFCGPPYQASTRTKYGHAICRGCANTEPGTGLGR